MYSKNVKACIEAQYNFTTKVHVRSRLPKQNLNVSNHAGFGIAGIKVRLEYKVQNGIASKVISSIGVAKYST